MSTSMENSELRSYSDDINDNTHVATDILCSHHPARYQQCTAIQAVYYETQRTPPIVLLFELLRFVSSVN